MKTMVITGASSGLGKVLAKHFATQNYKVCAIARSEDKLNELVKEFPNQIFAYTADVGDVKQVQTVFSAIFAEHKQIDVLINNASIYNSCPFYQENIENIDNIIDTNLKGTMYCTHSVLKQMIAKKSGHIINIASVSGTRGIPTQGCYGASKHGVVGFSDIIGQDVKEFGIHVCAICPGGIDTPLWNEKNPYPGIENDLIKPEELTELIEFILKQPTLYKKLIMFPMSEWH